MTGHLAPDFSTIACFRRCDGAGIRNVYRRFVVLCRDLKLFSQSTAAIDSSKIRAVNSRNRTFTPAKIERCKHQIEQSIERYLQALDTVDRTLPLLEFGSKCAQLTTKIEIVREQRRLVDQIQEHLMDKPDEHFC